MKKTLIAVAAAAALTATSAFAEITFGAWLRAVAVPVAHNGEDVVAGVQNSWGYGTRTARLNINAVSEDGKAGFVMGVYNDFEGGLGQGDDAYLWVKPVDTVKISVGKFDSPTNGLRGDFCYGSWNWLRPFNWLYDGEGLTFDGVSKNGLLVEADPIEGLHAFVAIPLTDDYTWNESTTDAAEYIYKNSQIGFGYAIEGVGKLKAQYIGDYAKNKKDVKKTYLLANKSKTEKGKVTWSLDPESDEKPTWQFNTEGDGNDDVKTTGKIGVAFDLTAVENLYVTVGARFGIADKDYAPDYLKMSFVAGASYQVSEQMKFSADGGYIQYQDKFNADDDSIFFVGAGVDFNVMDGLAAVADVRYMSNKYGKDGDEGAISFLVGVNKSVSSNGSLGIGFQGATNGCGFFNPGDNNETGIKANAADDFVWAIPVSVSVWF